MLFEIHATRAFVEMNFTQLVSSTHPVKGQSTTSQDAALRLGRGALDPLAHHVGRAREESVRVRVVRLRHKPHGDPAHAAISGKNSQSFNHSNAASSLGF